MIKEQEKKHFAAERSGQTSSCQKIYNFFQKHAFSSFPCVALHVFFVIFNVRNVVFSQLRDLH